MAAHQDLTTRERNAFATITCATANTAVGVDLPRRCRVTIQPDSVDGRWSYSATDIDGSAHNAPYFPLAANTQQELRGIDSVDTRTVYVSSSANGGTWTVCLEFGASGRE